MLSNMSDGTRYEGLVTLNNLTFNHVTVHHQPCDWLSTVPRLFVSHLSVPQPKIVDFYTGD